MLRFAPSPTGDMHIDDLRVAIFNYLYSLQINNDFIVRIEDTDKAKNIEAKDEEILLLLEKFAIIYSQKLYQSENLHIHQTLAIKLLKEKKAFICLCSAEDLEKDREKAKSNSITYRYSGVCVDSDISQMQELKENKTPFVIRIKKPTSDIIIQDAIKGDVTSTPNDVDSFVILRADGTPTHNFSSACDDILSGVNFIIQEEDNLSNALKQKHIKTSLGYESETKYAHLPIMLNMDGQKISKKDDTNGVKWLLEEGFLPDAIINYLILLGNNTQAPTEIFTLPEALKWFKLENISKQDVKFDINKLRFINREHIKLMDDKKLSTLFGWSENNIGKLAKIYLKEVSTTNEIGAKIKLIFSKKELNGEWAEEMKIIQDVIFDSPMIEEFNDFKKYITNKSGLNGAKLFKPLSLLMTGKEQGVELDEIYPLIKSYITEVVS
jgi:glutamyl-tRNA synthetase